LSEKRQLVGDFDFNAVAGTFEPDLSLLMPDRTVSGLHYQSQYLYGGLVSESGNVYVLERKFVGPMSGGNYILTNSSGTMELTDQSRRSAKGELVRGIEPAKRSWKSKGMLHDAAELPLEITVTDDHMSWSEGDALSLSGARPAIGIQFFSPMRTEPLGYASTVYWLKGEVLGEECEGPMFFDHVFFRQGAEWKEYRWFNDVQIAWNIFGNRYDDGTVEWGHIVRGRHGWNIGVVVENDAAVAACTNVGGDFRLDSEGYVDAASYDLGAAGVWRFDGDVSQQLAGFNEARWGGYRAQGGTMRRRGDRRRVIAGWCWLESFADRIKSEAMIAQ
jgi:hypothetical protein